MPGAMLAVRAHGQDIAPNIIDPESMRPHIKRWLIDWKQSKDPIAQQQATKQLFGLLVHGQYQPPDDIKAMLFARGLNYDDERCRYSAISNFGPVFWDRDPLPLLPIFRDAFNDSKPEIRQRAASEFGGAIVSFQLESPPPHVRWNEKTRREIIERRSELIEMSVDQIITKGLGDENEDVVEASVFALRLLKEPSIPHLRALDRAIARKAIRFPPHLVNIKEIRAEWHKRLYIDPNDPFGRQSDQLRP
jgi:HEAT repeat protein